MQKASLHWSSSLQAEGSLLLTVVLSETELLFVIENFLLLATVREVLRSADHSPKSAYSSSILNMGPILIFKYELEKYWLTRKSSQAWDYVLKGASSSVYHQGT